MLTYADVIYPAMDVDALNNVKKRNIIICQHLVWFPTKKVKLIVETFNEMPDKKLVVIGDGPDFAQIKAIAEDNITMMGYQPFRVLKEKCSMQRLLCLQLKNILA